MIQSAWESGLDIRFQPYLRCYLEDFEAFVLGVREGQAVIQVDYDEPFPVPIERFDPHDQKRIRERIAAGGLPV